MYQIVVALVNELPNPSSSPATGRIAIGSMKDLPTRCNTPKILSFIACTPFPQEILITWLMPMILFSFVDAFCPNF